MSGRLSVMANIGVKRPGSSPLELRPERSRRTMSKDMENGRSAPSGPARVCLIGAGSSGITAAKALHERGIPFDCFEKSDRVGGNWVFANKNGMSSAYRDLFINTSRPRMQYSDFPMSESFPDFPHHTHIAAYFRDYVDHFGFGEKISFETSVEHASRREDGTWEIELDNGETRLYDALLVANGHHWLPRWPEPAFPGADTFTGEQFHSHSYLDSSVFAGKRVVILGMGNSAMDISVEASYVADRTYLAARHGVWIVPKYMFGRPTDQFPDHAQMPFKIRKRLKHLVLKTTRAPPSATACRSPTTGSATPTTRPPAGSSIASPTERSLRSPTSNRSTARRCASSMAALSMPTSSCTAPATRSASRSSTRT
jgi:cation diffusion facilitator CzcD-associated flavoprotein CzcO